MKIDYANTVPMRVVFRKIGLKPFLEEDSLLYYRSPFCDGKETLIIDTSTNKWSYSPGKACGSVVDFICSFLKFYKEEHTSHDALRWLKNMIGYAVLTQPEGAQNYLLLDRQYRLKYEFPVSDHILIKYLEETRRIPFTVAKSVLREVDVRNKLTGKTFTALGLKNEEGGFAIRSQHAKAQVGKRYISFIRGQIVKPDGIHIFKDAMDYLSVLTAREGEAFNEDVMILNAYSNMSVSGAFIRGYGYTTAHTWLDNSIVGHQATQKYADFLKTEPDLKHKPMNKIYTGYKDVNSCHVAKRLNIKGP